MLSFCYENKGFSLLSLCTSTTKVDYMQNCITERTRLESHVNALREEQKSDIRQILLILVLHSFNQEAIDSQTGTNHKVSPEKYS